MSWKKSLALAMTACLGFVMIVHAADEKKGASSVLDNSTKSLAGKDVDLKSYKGKVVLIVNVASKCGYTRQYTGLQALHAKYAKDGLAVLGFPCNQFGGQEPGSAEEIASFCSSKFNVGFDMFEKVDVNGPGQCSVYKFLTSKETNPVSAGPIKWNFEKFLIGRDGQIVKRFASGAEPDSAEFIADIEKELAAKAK